MLKWAFINNKLINEYLIKKTALDVAETWIIPMTVVVVNTNVIFVVIKNEKDVEFKWK